MPGIAQRLAAALSDRYTIERELGAGGMATGYLAADLKPRLGVVHDTHPRDATCV